MRRYSLDNKNNSSPSLNKLSVALINGSELQNGFFNACGGSYTSLDKRPEVITAIESIGNLVSNMTIKQWENTNKGDRRVKDGLSRLVDIEPYKNMNRITWVKWLVTNLILYGEAFALPVMSRDGYLIEGLQPIDYNRVSVVMKSTSYEVIIDKLSNKPKRFAADEILHFVLNPDPNNPFVGTGYKIPLRDVLKTLKLASDTKASFMQSGLMPSLIIAADSLFNNEEEEDGKRPTDRVIKDYKRSAERGEPWVIPDELLKVHEIKPLTLSDIALNDNIEADKREVAAVLGIPSYLLGVGKYDRDEFNNFVSTKISNIAKTIEQELTKKLLISDYRYFKFDTNSLMDYSFSEKGSVYASLADKGIITPNEARDKLGFSWGGEELDKFRILENYIPVEDIGNQKKLNNKDGAE